MLQIGEIMTRKEFTYLDLILHRSIFTVGAYNIHRETCNVDPAYTAINSRCLTFCLAFVMTSFGKSFKSIVSATTYRYLRHVSCSAYI